MSVQINRALSKPIKDKILKDVPVLDSGGQQVYHKVPVLDDKGQPVLELVAVHIPGRPVDEQLIQKQVKLIDAPLTRDIIEPYIDTEADPDGIHFHVELDDARVLDFHIGRSAFEAVNTPEERQAIIDAEIAILSQTPADKLTTWTDGIL